jgi:hypothetical protein
MDLQQQQVRMYQWAFCRWVTPKKVSFVVSFGQILIPLTAETVEGLSLPL